MKFFRGQTLLSLIISLALSSFLMLVMIAFYSHTQRQNKTVLAQLQLQAELQRIIQTIGRDVRRAGFRALAPNLQQSNLFLFEQDEQGTSITIQQADNEPENSCLLFFYDINANGCIGSKIKARLV